MVIHTKEKIKIHVHENTEAKIKSESIDTSKSGAIINGSTEMPNKMNIRTKFRKAIFNDKGKVNHINQYSSVKREKLDSIAKNGKSIKLANMVAIKAASNQMEGVENIRDSIAIMSVMGTPLKKAANRGSKLFLQKAMKYNRSRKLKQVETKKTARKPVKETSPGSVEGTEKRL